MIKEYAKDLSRERERLAELRANIQLKKMRLATLELKALLDEGSEENVSSLYSTPFHLKF